MLGRTGIKPHGKRTRARSGRSLAERLPLPGGVTANAAIVILMFVLAVGVGAALGRWSPGSDSAITSPADDELIVTEVNLSPLFGLGGPVDALLAETDSGDDAYEDSLEEVREEAGLKKEFYVITAQDSIYNALKVFGVDHATITAWIKLAAPIYNLAKLKPGQSFWLFLDEGRRPVRFVFDIDRRNALVIERFRDGFVARREAAKAGDGDSVASTPAPRAMPVPGWVDPRTGLHYYQGTVTGSFYPAAIAAGMTPSKVMALLKVFGGLSFDREVKPGDRFRVVVAPGQVPNEEGPILAAMVETRGKPRYRFRVEQGKTAEYWNEKGEGGRKASAGFITPVRGARVTSRYSGRRFHPILHSYRPHYGVDYAARTGTPVRAAAGGVVIFAGWKGGFGRTLEIRHSGGSLVSQYAHLSGFGPKVTTGKSVKQGQVVGYIGSTGLSTGPHLDYRVYKNGAPVNPTRVTAPPPTPSPASQKAFTAARDRYLPELKRELPYGPARPWNPPAIVAQAATD